MRYSTAFALAVFGSSDGHGRKISAIMRLSSVVAKTDGRFSIALATAPRSGRWDLRRPQAGARVLRDDKHRSFSLILVCSSYPPVIGGSEVEAQRVCSALIRRGHRVTVATTGGAPMPPLRQWTDPAGVPVLLYAARWKGWMKNVAYAISIAWLLIRERRNYQAVYFLMQGLHLAVGLPVARLLGKTILMKVGGSGVLPAMAGSRTGRLEIRWLRKWAHCIMILKDGMRAEALAARLPPDKVVWMPNPVDTELFSPVPDARQRQLRAQHDILPDAFVIIYTGRLAPEKSLHVLLEAFA